MAASRPHLSAVIPVYGCEPCLRALHERLTASLQQVTDDYEIVLVEDRGPDGSWAVLQELAAADPRVVAVRFSRNFGQHAAITAGLAEARGDWVVILDCDLQDPPEEIPRLYAKAHEDDGHDVVFARRKAKPTSLMRRATARAYFRGMNLFTGTDIDGEYGTFSLISRKVVDSYLRFKDQDRHYLFIIYWLGFDHAAIDYTPSARFAGQSSYSFRKLIQHGMNGVFFQTTVLLRWIVYFGFALACIGALFSTYLVIRRLTGSAFPGFTSLAVLFLTVGGFIIFSTGITGLYIGKVFEQVKSRPLYIIDRRVSAVDEREQAEERSRAAA
jgi:dolichol-phosphate mannosyltransferase